MSGQLDTAYREHGDDLLRYIRSKVVDRDAAEDILHDVFERAATSASATAPIENLAGWLFRIAYHRVIDWYRRRFRRDVSLDAGPDWRESASLEDLLIASEIDLDNEIIRESVLDELGEAIDELPAGQREVIIRQAIGGETFKEIAADTGVSINTLLARKRYAVASIRRRLHTIQGTIEQILA